jgi:YVTN family beta-propeller protein
MKLFLSFLVLLVIAIGTSFVRAADTPANALLVPAKHDGTLAIVDPSSLQVIARIPAGKDPHEVIASSGGKTA